jgi:hypothetical protein
LVMEIAKKGKTDKHTLSIEELYEKKSNLE